MTRKDLVTNAIVQAIASFGGQGNSFNSAGFGIAFHSLCGVSGGMDGKVVHGILSSRDEKSASLTA